jgi:hypothetical protein
MIGATCLIFILLVLTIGCGKEESAVEESTPASGLLGAARDAAAEAGEVVGQAAAEAQTAFESASDTAQTTAAQVGDAYEAAATVVVDRGGEAVEVLGTAGKSASEEIQERFASLQPDEAGNFSVTIYESELNQIIKVQELLTGPIPGNPLRNTVVNFGEGVIIFTADVYEPLVGQLTVRFSPFIEEDRVRFAVLNASLGGAEAPEATLTTAEETLNSTLGAALGYLPFGLRPHEIIVTNGQFTIVGGDTPGG